jgi:hypothetical protein
MSLMSDIWHVSFWGELRDYRWSVRRSRHNSLDPSSHLTNIAILVLIGVVLGKLCCYRGVCPTPKRCNACLSALWSNKDTGKLARSTKLLCTKFWGDKCDKTAKTSPCHHFSPLRIFAATEQEEGGWSPWNCYKDGNDRCIADSKADCTCEDPLLSSRLTAEKFDSHLNGLALEYPQKQVVCNTLKQLSEYTRVKYHSSYDQYCDPTGWYSVNSNFNFAQG